MLVNTTDTFDGANIEGVLAAKIARMRRFHLTAGFIIKLFLLKGLDLCFGQDDAVLGDLRFQSLQAVLEVGKLVAQPDRPDARGRDKHALFAQLVGGSCLPIGRELKSGLDNSFLDDGINPVGRVWPATRLLQKRFNTAVIDSVLLAIEGIPGIAHHLTGFRDIAKFFGKVQKSRFVFDDLVGRMQHCGSLSFRGWVCTTNKTDNHIVSQEMFRPLSAQADWGRCQIKSELLHSMLNAICLCIV